MLVTIQGIAEDICEDMGDTTQKYFTTVLKKCLQGYRELYLFVTPQISVKSEILKCSRVIPLPADFVYLTKVGIMRGQQIATLFLDKNLRLSAADKTNLTTANEAIENYLRGIYIDGIATVPFYNTFRGGEFVGELYGLGNGFHDLGYYNIDAAERTILTSVGILPKDTELIIEYKSDGLPDGLKLVPSETEMAIRYFALWQFKQSRRMNEALVHRDDYRTEYTRLKALYNARPIDFMAEVFVENHKSSPK